MKRKPKEVKWGDPIKYPTDKQVNQMIYEADIYWSTKGKKDLWKSIYNEALSNKNYIDIYYNEEWAEIDENQSLLHIVKLTIVFLESLKKKGWIEGYSKWEKDANNEDDLITNDSPHIIAVITITFKPEIIKVKFKNAKETSIIKKAVEFSQDKFVFYSDGSIEYKNKEITQAIRPALRKLLKLFLKNADRRIFAEQINNEISTKEDVFNPDKKASNAVSDLNKILGRKLIDNASGAWIYRN